MQQKKNRRDKLYKRKQPGLISTEYIAAVIEFNALHERRYKEYIQRIQENIKSDPATFWQFANINSITSNYPNEMHLNNVIANTPDGIADMFSDYFESIYVSDEHAWNINEIIQSSHQSIDINVTIGDIELAISSLKWKSGAGPDKLSPFVVKMCSDAIVWPLWLLFEKNI